MYVRMYGGWLCWTIQQSVMQACSPGCYLVIAKAGCCTFQHGCKCYVNQADVRAKEVGTLQQQQQQQQQQCYLQQDDRAMPGQ
jgi:hypothetical protein